MKHFQIKLLCFHQEPLDVIIALTGTPGTGKTSVAEKLDFPVTDLKEFVKERGLGEQREEFEVDIEDMVDALEDEVENGVIEGHLAHHVPADYCVVLRCAPDELRSRLQQRDYPAEKVEENVQAEILDIILQEAVEKQENIIEVDTTGRSADRVAGEIEERIEKGDTGYGEIDWTSAL